MSLFYKQNAAARFFVDQTNGKVRWSGDRRRCCAAERREGSREGGRAAAWSRRAVGRRRDGVEAGAGRPLLGWMRSASGIWAMHSTGRALGVTWRDII